MFTEAEAMIRHSVPPFDVVVTLGELYSRARVIVPVVKKEWLPPHSRGMFIHHPNTPWLDHIALPQGKCIAEETMVLAHELGHAENCKLEPERWNVLQIHLKFMCIGIRPLANGIGLLIEEEMLANKRGRLHLQEICPELVTEFDRQMAMSLHAFIIRISRMP
jgi:hypothetical protein